MIGKVLGIAIIFIVLCAGSFFLITKVIAIARPSIKARPQLTAKTPINNQLPDSTVVDVKFTKPTANGYRAIRFINKAGKNFYSINLKDIVLIAGQTEIQIFKKSVSKNFNHKKTLLISQDFRKKIGLSDLFTYCKADMNGRDINFTAK